MMEVEERIYWEERRRYEEELEYYEWCRRHHNVPHPRGMPIPPPIPGHPYGPPVGPPLMPPPPPSVSVLFHCMKFFFVICIYRTVRLLE